jgi:hypothetical protein
MMSSLTDSHSPAWTLLVKLPLGSADLSSRRENDSINPVLLSNPQLTPEENEWGLSNAPGTFTAGRVAPSLSVAQSGVSRWSCHVHNSPMLLCCWPGPVRKLAHSQV